MGDPDSGDQGEDLLDRREPLGTRHRVRRHRGPVGRPAGRALHPDARHQHRAGRADASASSAGVPTAIDGVEHRPRRRSSRRSTRAPGATGFGRLDMVENRRVGIKSREVYECPGGPRRSSPRTPTWKTSCSSATSTTRRLALRSRWAELVYDGMWFSPLEGGPRRLHRRHPAPRDR